MISQAEIEAKLVSSAAPMTSLFGAINGDFTLEEQCRISRLVFARSSAGLVLWPPGWNLDWKVGSIGTEYVLSFELQCLHQGQNIRGNVLNLLVASLHSSHQWPAPDDSTSSSTNASVPAAPILGPSGLLRADNVKVYCFHDAWFQKLRDLALDASSLTRSLFYSSFRSWLSSYKRSFGHNVLAADVILVPVNVYNIHWLLAALDMTTHTIHVYDSLVSSQAKLRVSDLVSQVRKWIEWECSTGALQLPSSAVLRPWSVQFHSARDVPQQTNGIDCGVFMYAFIKQIISKRTGFEGISQSQVPCLRARMALEVSAALLRS